jgi:glucuronate isomerase
MMVRWGKIQYGSGWWFLDQKDGMTKQINALSNMGMLSRFVGMLTDSRSFLSFPRHEYFRRLLCNMFGEEIEKGELPNDLAWTGKVIQDICYNNAVTILTGRKCPGLQKRVPSEPENNKNKISLSI